MGGWAQLELTDVLALARCKSQMVTLKNARMNLIKRWLSFLWPKSFQFRFLAMTARC